jgi:hypothetical protein
MVVGPCGRCARPVVARVARAQVVAEVPLTTRKEGGR